MRRKKTVRTESDKIRSILITKTAIKELISEDVIEKVIMFQFKDFRNMIFEHDQIEVSGFGKFLVSPNKVAKKMEQLERAVSKFKAKLNEEPDAPQKRKDYWQTTVDECTAAIEDLKTRTNGYENKH